MTTKTARRRNLRQKTQTRLDANRLAPLGQTASSFNEETLIIRSMKAGGKKISIWG